MSGQSEDAARSDVEGGTVGGHRLDRRSLIKKAGIVGAAAWVAPMVIDSMISPASAASLAPGIYKVRLAGGLCDPTPVRPILTDPPACPPADWGLATLVITDFAMLTDFGIVVDNCHPRFQLTLRSTFKNVVFLGGSGCHPVRQGGGSYVADAPDQYNLIWPGPRGIDANGYFVVFQVF